MLTETEFDAGDYGWSDIQDHLERQPYQVTCYSCGNALTIKNPQVDSDGDILASVEVCSCYEEEITGLADEVENLKAELEEIKKENENMKRVRRNGLCNS